MKSRRYLRKAEPFVVPQSVAECGVQILYCLGCPTTTAGPSERSEPLLLCCTAITEQEEGVLPRE